MARPAGARGAGPGEGSGLPARDEAVEAAGHAGEAPIHEHEHADRRRRDGPDGVGAQGQHAANPGKDGGKGLARACVGDEHVSITH